MRTQEILSITALSALGLCLLCGLAKITMKSNEAKKSCDKACGMLVFAAVVLVAVSQLLEEIDEKLELGKDRSFWLQSDSKSDCENFVNKYSYKKNIPKFPNEDWPNITKCYEEKSESCESEYCIGQCVSPGYSGSTLLMYFKSGPPPPTCLTGYTKNVQQFTE